jgi:hypothetical protein
LCWGDFAAVAACSAGDCFSELVIWVATDDLIFRLPAQREVPETGCADGVSPTASVLTCSVPSSKVDQHGRAGAAVSDWRERSLVYDVCVCLSTDTRSHLTAYEMNIAQTVLVRFNLGVQEERRRIMVDDETKACKTARSC